MKKLIAFALLILLFTACGAPETEMDYDAAYQILSVEEGDIAGISVGDSWADAEKNMERLHKGVFTADNQQVVGSFTIDYGVEGRQFGFDCVLRDGKIQSIKMNISDILANEAKIVDLHEKVAKYFMEKYPDGYTHQKDAYSEYGTVLLPGSEKKINITAPHLVGIAAGATKAQLFSIEVF